MLNTIDGPATSAKAEELGELKESELPAPRNLRIKEGAKVIPMFYADRMCNVNFL